MRNRFGWFRRKRASSCCGGTGTRQYLSACTGGEKGVVLSNPDHRTKEMGFAHGARIALVRNDPGDDSMVVVLNESRFAIPRDVATQMMLCLGGDGKHHERKRNRQCSAT